MVLEMLVYVLRRMALVLVTLQLVMLIQIMQVMWIKESLLQAMCLLWLKG